MDHQTILVIGGGNMARAIIEGVAAKPPADLAPVRWIIADPDEGKHASLAAIAGVEQVVASAAELAPYCTEGAQVLLAVKPQMLGAVAETTRGWGVEGVVVSILAGARSEAVREAFGGKARVVRVMPNTPAAVGRGMACVAAGAGAREGDTAVALGLMRAVGEAIEVDEGMVDAFTAIGGSGPAYLFYLAEGMVRGGEAVGFSKEDARRIVMQTLVGAAELLAARGGSPEDLRAAVTSKGGTTAAAMGVLDDAGVMQAVERAAVAARDRGVELGAR